MFRCGFSTWLRPCHAILTGRSPWTALRYFFIGSIHGFRVYMCQPIRILLHVDSNPAHGRRGKDHANSHPVNERRVWAIHYSRMRPALVASCSKAQSKSVMDLHIERLTPGLSVWTVDLSFACHCLACSSTRAVRLTATRRSASRRYKLTPGASITLHIFTCSRASPA